MITATDALEILGALEGVSLSVWLDGGWGVDALLGEQTRLHDDLDLVVQLKDSNGAIGALAAIGFRLDIEARPTRFVVGDDTARRIDFHTVVFGEDGSARQIGAGARGGDATYPLEGFDGIGEIGGYKVPCLTAELLVAHHQGYEPQAKDCHNVELLCARFSIPLPSAYR